VLIDLFQTNSPGNAIDAKYLTELAHIGIEMKDPDIVLVSGTPVFLLKRLFVISEERQLLLQAAKIIQ